MTMNNITLDQIDVMGQNLSQATAVLSLLLADGGDLNHGFTQSHNTIHDAIWCVDTLVENVHEQLRGGVK